MDIRTWQEAGSRAGSYSARHRARNPFSPLRPAPIAIGSLSTAAIAAFAFAAPGILRAPGAPGMPLLDGMPNRVAPLAPGSDDSAAPGGVTVTATTSPSSDAPTTPSSTSASSAPAVSPVSKASAVRTPTMAASSPQPSLPQPSQPPQTSPTTQPAPPTQSPPSAPPPSSSPPTTTPPTTPPTITSPTAFNSPAAVAGALNEIGAARSRQGVSPLTVDPLLVKLARVHTADMVLTGDFSHIGSDGSDPYSRAADLGCFTLSQELIAHGRPGDDVIGALMRDPASRRALLSFWNTMIGISAQLDPTTGDVYWTIELGWT